MKHIRIGTRGSKLALWQAHFTQKELEKNGITSDLTIIKTKGDRIQHLSFDKIEGKGFFTREIEDALLRGDIDLAVHSMKDLPTESPKNLAITAVSYRENPADWILMNKEAWVDDLVFNVKANAIVGTSSARRKAQLNSFRNDFEIKDIRGNVPTRIRKLREGQFDAIVLAAAGITRLDLDIEDLKIFKLHPKEFIPAPAQGVLAFQTVKSDVETRRLLKAIHHQEVSDVTNVERKVLKLLDGGCHMPLGVYCEKDQGGNYHVWAAMSTQHGAPLQTAKLSSATSYQLAEKIIEQLKT